MTTSSEDVDLEVSESVAEAVESGNQLDVLEALAARLGKAIDEPVSSASALAALAALSRQLVIVIDRIEKLRSQGDGGDDDLLADTPDEDWDPEAI